MTRTHPKIRGIGNGMAKLTLSDVIHIKTEIYHGEENMKLASRYGVTGSTISNIRTGRTWNHITIQGPIVNIYNRAYSQGTRNGMAKLNIKKVREIKVAIANGSSNPILAKQYGVTSDAISKIRTGKTWNHVEVQA